MHRYTHSVISRLVFLWMTGHEQVDKPTANNHRAKKTETPLYHKLNNPLAEPVYSALCKMIQ